jgi:hypothetical protein
MRIDGLPLPRCGDSPSDWEWPISDRIELIKPDFIEQCPEPTVMAPEGYTFPQAPVYIVNEHYDARCPRGYFLHAPFDTKKVSEYKEHFNHLVTPPNVNPYRFDSMTRTWFRKPIPGVSQMKPGWQYAHTVDGDMMKLVTVAVLHTPTSLVREFPDGHEIESLGDRLCDIAFGYPPRGDNPGQKPLYELEGLKPNDRSGPTVPGSWDGSYNLASTLIKGKGRGVCAPAVTAAYKDAVDAIAEVGQILHSIFRHIIKKSLFREEFEAIEWHSTDNNVFGFGGLEPNNTGLQMNVSSTSRGGTLSVAIGDKQGSWHVDQSDDPARWTVFVLCFNLPPGG